MCAWLFTTASAIRWKNLAWLTVLVVLAHVHYCVLLSSVVVLCLCTVDMLIFCRLAAEKMYRRYEKFNICCF